MQLVHYLKKLSQTERENFNEYLRMQSQRVPEKQLSILTYLEAHLRDSTITVENVAIQIFLGNEKQHHKKVHDNVSEILKKLKLWLAHQQLKKEPLWQNLLLTRALSERNMHEDFMLLSEDFIQNIESSNQQSMDALFARLSLTDAMYQHPLTAKLTTKNTLLDDSLEALEKFYLINKLRIGAAIVNEKKDEKDEKDRNHFLNDWDSIKEKAVFLNNELVNLYVDLVSLLVNLSENEFMIQELWQKMITVKSEIPDVDLRFLSISLINCCNKLIVKGKKEYYDIYLQIYLHGIDTGYLLENNQMPTATFKNISLALAVRQDEAAFEDFLEKYLPFLKSDERNNAKFLATTYFYCFAKKFDVALENLRQIQSASIMTKYSCYLLEINIFLEKQLAGFDYADSINSKIAAFRQFITRDKTLSDAKKEAYHNYLLIIGSIFNHIYHQKPSISKTIKEDIRNKTPLVSREWLAEIANRL
jgi:hypothetical protein